MIDYVTLVSEVLTHYSQTGPFVPLLLKFRL